MTRFCVFESAFHPLHQCNILASPGETCGLRRERAGAALGAGPLQMLRAKSNSRISTPDVSSDQSVDWEQRDFTQTIQLGMTQLTAFLNEFGTHACLLHLPAAPIADWPRDRTDGTMRGRMAQLNGKLGKLERQMQVIEATLTSVDDKQ